jgi:hypothetical protein
MAKEKEPDWKPKIRSAFNKFREKELPLWHDKKNAEYIFRWLEKELEL